MDGPPIEISEFSHLLEGSDGSYSVNVDGLLQEYINDFGLAAAYMFFFIIFHFLYYYVVHPFIYDYVRNPRVLWVSSRINNVFQRLAQGGSVFLLWVAHKQGVLPPFLWVIILTLFGVSVVIMLFSLGSYLRGLLGRYQDLEE